MWIREEVSPLHNKMFPKFLLTLSYCSLHITTNCPEGVFRLVNLWSPLLCQISFFTSKMSRLVVGLHNWEWGCVGCSACQCLHGPEVRVWTCMCVLECVCAHGCVLVHAGIIRVTHDQPFESFAQRAHLGFSDEYCNIPMFTPPHPSFFSHPLFNNRQ